MGLFDRFMDGYNRADNEIKERKRAEEEARIAKAQDDERRSRLTPEELAAEDRQRTFEEDERRRWNSFMSDRSYKNGVVAANFATDNIDFFFKYHAKGTVRLWQQAADAGRLIQELNRNNDYAQTVLNNRLANIEDKIDKQGELISQLLEENQKLRELIKERL